MKERKVIITDSEKEINDLLSDGWEIVSVTAQHVGVVQPNSYSFALPYIIIEGKFCFVIERRTSKNQ